MSVDNQQPDSTSQSPDKGPPGQPGPQIDNTAPVFKRIAAALIDLIVTDLIASVVLGLLRVDLTGVNPFQVPVGLAVKLLACFVLVFFAINSLMLFKYGQTLGKRLMNIAIVDIRGGPSAPANLIINRYASQVAMLFVPLLNFVDIFMMLLRRDRRCLHDLLAKTRVIDLGIKAANAAEGAGNSMIA